MPTHKFAFAPLLQRLLRYSTHVCFEYSYNARSEYVNAAQLQYDADMYCGNDVAFTRGRRRPDIYVVGAVRDYRAATSGDASLQTGTYSDGPETAAA